MSRQLDMLEASNQKDASQMTINAAALNEIYADLYTIVGAEKVAQIFKQQAGIQVTFPTHLYNRQKLIPIIKAEYNGHNSRELARTYGYSERWVKRMLRD